MLPHDSLHTYTLRMIGIAYKCSRIPKNEVFRNAEEYASDLLAKAKVHEYSAVSPKEHMAIETQTNKIQTFEDHK